MDDSKRLCPRCGERGRATKPETVTHLVREPDRVGLTTTPAIFCATPACEVVYFDANGGTVLKQVVRVPVFQKELGPERPVCYCFEHSVEDVLAAARPDDSNAIVDEIMEACRKGLDRCEETNPQGRCCLGNIRGLLRVEPTRSCCGGS